MSLLDWLMKGPVSESDIRAEIWRLGGRHFGRPLDGALEELKATNLSAERIQLLRACARRLQCS